MTAQQLQAKRMELIAAMNVATFDNSPMSVLEGLQDQYSVVLAQIRALETPEETAARKASWDQYIANAVQSASVYSPK